MKLSRKQLIIISVIVLVVIILLFAWTYYAGKKAGANPSNVQITTDIAGTPLTNEQATKLRGLSVNLYNDMDGLNWSGWDYELYKEVSLLSDSLLVALSNIFNNQYEKETEQTFLQWLKNENFNAYSFSTQTVVNTIISRLTQLGVS